MSCRQGSSPSPLSIISTRCKIDQCKQELAKAGFVGCGPAWALVFVLHDFLIPTIADTQLVRYPTATRREERGEQLLFPTQHEDEDGDVAFPTHSFHHTAARFGTVIIGTARR